MDRRFRHTRKAHRRTLYFFQRMLRRPVRGPRYARPRLTDEQRANERNAIIRFVGSCSPNPTVARYYQEQCRRAQIAHPASSEAYRQKMRDEGPGCTALEEAEALASMGEEGLARHLPPPELAEHGFAAPQGA